MTIREYRQHLNLTQEQFGERLGVSAQQVSNWENGFRFPSAKSLLNLAETYGVNVQISKKGVYIVPDPKPSPVFDCALSGDEIVSRKSP